MSHSLVKERNMKILVIGATGTIGQAVVANLEARHEVLQASKTQAALSVDICDEASLRALFEHCGPIDAIVSTTGNVHFGPLADMTAIDFNTGLQDKLLGQVNIALIGQHYLNANGCITLCSGIVSTEPVLGGVNATTVNAAIEAFALAAGVELPDNKRINVICPTVVTESLATYGDFFPGFESVPVNRVAKAYQRSIEGALTGQTFRVL